MPNRGTCLIVEDSAFQAKICEKAISSMGYQCVLAADGSDALRKLSTVGDIRLVLSDINMPGMNGLQLLSQVKMQDNLRDLPFILITSQSDRATVVQAAQLGCKGFLRKPYTSVSLKQKVQQLIDPPDSLIGKILLVDDRPEECQKLKQSVQRAAPKAPQIDFAHSLESAKALLEAGPPELLLVSYELESAKGHDLLKWVKSRDDLANLPVVVLSNPVAQDVVAQSYANGATCHLLRSGSSDELANTLTNLADFWQTRQKGA